MTTNDTKVQADTSIEEQIKILGSKSALIRKLSAEGIKRGDIAKMMGIRYQHVRNVLITPIKTK